MNSRALLKRRNVFRVVIFYVVIDQVRKAQCRRQFEIISGRAPERPVKTAVRLAPPFG